MMTAVLSRAGGVRAHASPPTREPASSDRLNINPTTGLATDYLNHFNEAIMLLEMASCSPEAIADFFAWQPLSYGEHFAASRFASRETAIAAYDDADPLIRRHFDSLTDTMTMILMTAHAVLSINPPQPEVEAVARRAVANLKPLVARAGAVINGNARTDDEMISPQQVIDALMER
jgi:hypothetical protein